MLGQTNGGSDNTTPGNGLTRRGRLVAQPGGVPPFATAASRGIDAVTEHIDVQRRRTLAAGPSAMDDQGRPRADQRWPVTPAAGRSHRARQKRPRPGEPPSPGYEMRGTLIVAVLVATLTSASAGTASAAPANPPSCMGVDMGTWAREGSTHFGFSSGAGWGRYVSAEARADSPFGEVNFGAAPSRIDPCPSAHGVEGLRGPVNRPTPTVPSALTSSDARRAARQPRDAGEGWLS